MESKKMTSQSVIVPKTAPVGTFVEYDVVKSAKETEHKYIKVGEKWYRKYGKTYMPICFEHGRQSHQCKDCGGISCCTHGRLRNDCRDCKGTSICEHGKKKYVCRDCKGKGWCIEHDCVKNKCVKCKGGGVCEHDKRRSRCKECKGGEICEHDKIRYDCRDCKGNGICEHDKSRSKCIDCNGGKVIIRKKCSHGKRKESCKECKGNDICTHGINKRICKPCKGKDICPHYRSKHQCVDCGGSKTCKYHHTSMCYTLGNPAYQGYCTSCFRHVFPDKPINKRSRTKEQHVVQFIKEHFPDFDWSFDKKVSEGCSRRRPDIYCDFGSHNVIIEIDEYKHEGYSCENKRIMEIMQDGGLRPLVVVRFNPDEYLDKDGNKVTTCWAIGKTGQYRVKPSKVKEWAERLDKLKETVKEMVESVPEKEVTVVHLFY